LSSDEIKAAVEFAAEATSKSRRRCAPAQRRSAWTPKWNSQRAPPYAWEPV